MYRDTERLMRKVSLLSWILRVRLSKKEGNDEPNPPFKTNHNKQTNYLAVYRVVTSSGVSALSKIRNSSSRLRSEK